MQLSAKKTLFQLLLWWLTMTLLWAIVRLRPWPDVYSEFLFKPFVWWGVLALFIWRRWVPTWSITQLRQLFIVQPPIKMVAAPALFALVYFSLMNWRYLALDRLSDFGPIIVVIFATSLATALVEEVVFRGYLYTQLLKQTNELLAFLLVQVLFVLIHVPSLVYATSLVDVGIRVFFIVVMSSTYTGIFRTTNSLVAASTAHTVWNFLVALFLL